MQMDLSLLQNYHIFAKVKDLSRHIEYLLATHDAVSVPGLCTFVTDNKSARYIHSEQTFLPPYRSVFVDNRINPEDTLLEDCIMQMNHVRRNIAAQWIEDYTADIRSTIIEQGSVEIGSIGELSQNGSGFMFNVCDAGINSPVLYGLDSFLFAKLPEAERTNNDADTPRITFSVKRSTVQSVLSAAAILLIAFILFVPQLQNINTREAAHLFSWNNIESVIAKIRAQHGKQPVIAEEATAPHKQDAEIKSPAKESETVTPSGYCVVMASAISSEMADAYVLKLKDMGFDNAVKVVSGKMVRVVLAGYGDDSAKAYAKVNEIRDKDPLFAQIWVMAL